MARRAAIPPRPAPSADWLVRPHPHHDTTYVSQSRTVLATDRDGFIQGQNRHGLWVYQARNISRYRWLVEGKQPRSAGQSNLEQHTWLGYYIAAPPNYKEMETQESDPAQQTIEVRLSRVVGDGMHEHVDVTNHTQIATAIRLELEVEADFADPKEAQGERKQKGKLQRTWRAVDEKGGELDFDYRVQHRYAHQGDKGIAGLHRGVTVRVENAGSPPVYQQGRIRFRVKLAPHGTWHACVRLQPRVEGVALPRLISCRPWFAGCTERDRKREAFLEDATRFKSGENGGLSGLVIGALERSKRDLAALRLYDLDGEGGGWVMAGGVPSYVALFGRDTLATAWEASLVSPEMMRGVLAVHPKWQGTKLDDWRDEQPGRILHEAHTNPLSVLNFGPHGRYYGGVTGSIYYPTVAATLWHWTGNKQLVAPYIQPALKALAWADQYGDLDGDGFYEYRTRSEQGEKNQGWKDSADAIVHADGAQVKDPLGTCEMQAFVYASKLFMSEMLTWFGERELARRLHRQAEELKQRFNEVFWMDDENYLAMGLDARKRQIRSIASDPGHCLASGIVQESFARRLADRMLSPDLFSGWGVRTLSAAHPAFNPFSYHRGSVWPVENAVFALAMARYGLHEHMHRIARAQFETAKLFDYYRLPEVFAGHQRDAEHPFPGLYPRANWPQAWSAAAVFTLVQAMCGIYPYAPLNVLMVDPHLPEWLPELVVDGLRVAGAKVTLRFRRNPDGSSSYDVLGQKGKLHVLRQPSPWSLTAGLGERVKDAIVSLLPGK